MNANARKWGDGWLPRWRSYPPATGRAPGRWAGLLLVLALHGVALAGDGAVLRVGPDEALKVPSAAARVAGDGAVVEIAAGDYFGDVAVWRQNHLTLRGVNGRAHLHAAGAAADGKAIWVIRGDAVTVENIEFSGTKVPSLNGAGIRGEGAALTIRNCHFHHNENGLMANRNQNAVLTVIASEFDHNIVDHARTGRLGHNIYIGNIRRFVLTDSDVHNAVTGHQVKSRARENEITNNRIRDADGGSSYLIDLPDGGIARISGNVLQQSAAAPNRTGIAFAAEANRNAAFGTSLMVTDNQFTSDGSPGTFVRNHSTVPVTLRHNSLHGRVTPLRGPGTVE